MPSIVINSHIFGERFGTDEMRALFSDHVLIQHYLDVEAAPTLPTFCIEAIA